MANLMHRFFRSKSCINQIHRLTPSLITQQKPIISNIESVFQKPEQVSSAKSTVISLSGNDSDHSMQFFYPSFSMSYFLNPNMIQNLDLTETGPLDEKDAKEIVIYADSVKKKRKKKMNKHKYRKLRKRLGRKS